MNITRIRRALTRRASLPGAGQPPATQRKTRRPHRVRRPGRDNFAGRFSLDVAAAATVAVGQHWPPAPANPTRRAL
jgi:hypothetical protein